MPKNQRRPRSPSSDAQSDIDARSDVRSDVKSDARSDSVASHPPFARRASSSEVKSSQAPSLNRVGSDTADWLNGLPTIPSIDPTASTTSDLSLGLASITSRTLADETMPSYMRELVSPPSTLNPTLEIVENPFPRALDPRNRMNLNYRTSPTPGDLHDEVSMMVHLQDTSPLLGHGSEGEADSDDDEEMMDLLQQLSALPPAFTAAAATPRSTPPRSTTTRDPPVSASLALTLAALAGESDEEEDSDDDDDGADLLLINDPESEHTISTEELPEESGEETPTPTESEVAESVFSDLPPPIPYVPRGLIPELPLSRSFYNEADEIHANRLIEQLERAVSELEMEEELSRSAELQKEEETGFTLTIVLTGETMNQAQKKMLLNAFSRGVNYSSRARRRVTFEDTAREFAVIWHDNGDAEVAPSEKMTRISLIDCTKTTGRPTNNLSAEICVYNMHAPVTSEKLDEVVALSHEYCIYVVLTSLDSEQVLRAERQSLMIQLLERQLQNTLFLPGDDPPLHLLERMDTSVLQAYMHVARETAFRKRRSFRENDRKRKLQLFAFIFIIGFIFLLGAMFATFKLTPSSSSSTSADTDIIPPPPPSSSSAPPTLVEIPAQQPENGEKLEEIPFEEKQRSEQQSSPPKKLPFTERLELVGSRIKHRFWQEYSNHRALSTSPEALAELKQQRRQRFRSFFKTLSFSASRGGEEQVISLPFEGHDAPPTSASLIMQLLDSMMVTLSDTAGYIYDSTWMVVISAVIVTEEVGGFVLEIGQEVYEAIEPTIGPTVRDMLEGRRWLQQMLKHWLEDLKSLL